MATTKTRPAKAATPAAKKPQPSERQRAVARRTRFDWADTRLQTVLWLIFEGRLAQSQVAAKVGVPARTLERWIARPDFKAKLATLREDFAASMREVTYADKAKRVVALSLMAESARAEYEARPLVTEVRPTRDGNITNEAFNEAAFSSFRGALDDIAKELGERQKKVDVSGGVDVNQRVVFVLPEIVTEELLPPIYDAETVTGDDDNHGND